MADGGDSGRPQPTSGGRMSGSAFRGSVVSAIGASQVLHLLSEAGRARLADVGSAVALAPGATLFSAGDPGDSVFVVLEGEVEVRATSAGGRDVRFQSLGAGSLVGEMAALDGGPRSADVVAARRCRLWRIPRAALVDALEAEPRAAVALIAELSRRLRDTNDALEAEMALDLGGRLARLLVAEAGSKGLVALTQTEIARRLGASREKVNRKLHDFAGETWIEITPAGVLLRDPDRLKALVARGLAGG